MKLPRLFLFSLILVAGCARSERPEAPNPKDVDVKVKVPEVPAPVAKSVVLKGRNPKAKWAKELTDLDVKYASLQGDYKAKSQEMLAWLKNRPEYEASGISRIGNAWARFTDGRLVMIPFPEPGTRGSGQATNLPFQAAPAPGAAPTPRFVIPASRQARLLEAFPDSLRSPIQDHLVPWLTAAGYKPIRGDASVDTLRSVRGDAIFYIDTHGVSVPERGNNDLFCMVTGMSGYDADDPETAAQWDADLQAGRLAYTSFGAGHYGVTHKFVRHYMSFSDGAFVFINACSSDMDPAFIQAFLDKGATVYAGWTRLVSDRTANVVAKFYFDRLLGRNQFRWEGWRRMPPIELENPRQRPFDFALLFHDMQQRQIDVDHYCRYFYDPRGTVPLWKPPPTPPIDFSQFLKNLVDAGMPTEVSDKLKDLVVRKRSDPEFLEALKKRLTTRELMIYSNSLIAGGSDFGCHLKVHYSPKVIPALTGLSPSIMQAWPFDLADELNISGQFGPGTPQVTVGGTTVEFKRWEGQANEQGRGSFVCKLPRAGPGSAGDVIVTMDGRVSNPVPLTDWRVKLRHTREQTNLVPPIKQTAEIDLHFRADIHSVRMLPHETPRPVAEGGVGSAFLTMALDSKVHWNLSGKGAFKTAPQATVQWAGSGNLTREQAVPGGKGLMNFSARLDAPKKRVGVSSFSISIPKAGTATNTNPNMTKTSDQGFHLSAQDWHMPLDEKFGIIKGEHSWSDEFFKMKLEWDAAPAQHPPTAETLSMLPWSKAPLLAANRCREICRR